MRAPWWLPWGQVEEVTTQDLLQWMEEGRALQFVDARTGLEYRAGTIGNATHAPVTDMPGSLDRISLDPDRPVIALCLSGHRSRPAVRRLRAKGIEAYSLKGGILAWKSAGNLVQPPGN